MLHQIALVNDCIYSAANQFRWVTSHDLDEYIFVANTNGSLITQLDLYEGQTEVSALLLKSWVHEPVEEPWKSDVEGQKCWGDTKRESVGTDLGSNQELLTFKHFNRKHARPIQDGYFKWYTKTATTESVDVHGVRSVGHSAPVHVSEVVMHFKHYYELYNHRPIDCSGGKYAPGWCPLPGDAAEFKDTTLFDQHGVAFLQLWPYGHHKLPAGSALASQSQQGSSIE